jgi:hypothetical protein
MLKAQFIGASKTGSWKYRVIGTTAEVTAFKVWNTTQVNNKTGEMIKRTAQNQDVLFVPMYNRDEQGNVTGTVVPYPSGTVIHRALVAGDRIGEMIYEFEPDAKTASIINMAQAVGTEITTMMHNIGAFNAVSNAQSTVVSANPVAATPAINFNAVPLLEAEADGEEEEETEE